MSAIQPEWNQQDIIDHSIKNGDDNHGSVSEEEYIAAAIEMSEGQVTEDQARAWFNNTRNAAGQSNQEEITFSTIPADRKAAVAEEFNGQANAISLAKKSGMALTEPGVFEHIAGEDGEISKEEWNKYVRNEMPGGDLIPQEQVDSMFNMLARPDQDGSTKDTITKEEFLATADDGSKVIDKIQAHATNLSQSPPSETDKMLEALENLIKTLEQQQQTNGLNEFNY
jgi:hypothetical protein